MTTGEAAAGGGPGSPLTPASTLDVLAERLLAVPPRLGQIRLVSIDGPAGSGKSTLARDLAGHLHDAGHSVTVLGMDEMFEGWTGLDVGVGQLLTTVLVPIADGRPGSYRRYDWVAQRWAEDGTVPVTDVLVVEGCGSAPRAAADWTSLIVVVETDRETRLARGLQRDGEHMRADWLAWMDAEEAVFARELVRERADVRLDGCGEIRRPG